MSKKEKESKSTLPLIFILPFTIGIIVALMLSTCALTNCNEKSDPLIDVVNGMLIVIQITNDKMDLLQDLIIQTRDNALERTTALEEYDIVITKQIGNIRSDINSKFPQASDVIDEGQESTTLTTPFLTLKMDKTEFVLGNTIMFRGTAHPNDSVQITLKLPDRMLIPIVISRDMIIDAAYITNYTLRLDDPVGTWEAYARQSSDQTRTLTFQVE